jgi:hypothetical protein
LADRFRSDSRERADRGPETGRWGWRPACPILGFGFGFHFGLALGADALQFVESLVEYTLEAGFVAGEIGAVGLHAELGNCIRAGHHVNEVAQGGVARNTVVIGGALVRHAAADLVITGSEDVLPGYGVPIGSALRHHARHQGGEVHDIAAVHLLTASHH